MAERAGGGSGIVWPSMRAEILYEHFKQRIIDRDWLPGAQLNIDRLAREYEVSITPVREALARLSSDRLVVAAPHRGYTVVPPPSFERLRDLFTVRLLLEPHAAAGAAQRRSQDDLEVLRTAQTEIMVDGAGADYTGMQAYAARNRIFHERIFLANANEVLTEVYKQLNYHVVIAHVYHSAGITDIEQVVLEHNVILDALEAGDTQAAEEAMRVHIDQGSQRLLKLYLDSDSGASAQGSAGSAHLAPRSHASSPRVKAKLRKAEKP